MQYFNPQNYKLTKQETRVLVAINKHPNDFTTLSIELFAQNTT